MTDRRYYQRINVSAEGVFLLNNNEVSSREFPGVILNISESGFMAELDMNESSHILPHISSGTSIHFQAVDSFDLYNNKMDSIIMGDARIVRQDCTNDSIIIGCSFYPQTAEITNYVSNKKVSKYLDTLAK